MVELVAIKKDLPGWPDEVVTEWLLYLANREDTGWPPPEPLGGSWAAILADSQNVSYSEIVRFAWPNA